MAVPTFSALEEDAGLGSGAGLACSRLGAGSCERIISSYFQTQVQNRVLGKHGLF